MTLDNVSLGKECIIKQVQADDSELVDFLFTLGCYSGEKIVVVSMVSGNYVVSIKDARYNIDRNLAQAILVEQAS